MAILHGLGGVGKTTIALKVKEEVKNYFDRIIWHDFEYTDPPQFFLIELIKKLSSHVGKKTIQDQRQLTLDLIRKLDDQKLLIILDEKNNEEYASINGLTISSNADSNNCANRYWPQYQKFFLILFVWSTKAVFC